MQIECIITQEQSGQRLDAVIAGIVEDCSRKTAARSISEQQVIVNGMSKKPGYRVRVGDRLTGRVEIREAVSRVAAEKITLDILYEDGHILVINKKAGMVVHPAAGHETGTLVNALMHHHPVIETIGSDFFRSGIVHRLDKDTSGIMVAAKTEQSLDFLQKEFRMRRVRKTYLALVEGNDLDDQGQIDLPIGRHPVKRKQMAINAQTGKTALTIWRVLKRLKDACLVEVFLMTGRTHQIRVHFYEMGHPLVGDPVYQYRKQRKKNKTERQMLHARHLSFRHPYSGRRMDFFADPPRDFTDKAAWLEKNSAKE